MNTDNGIDMCCTPGKRSNVNNGSGNVNYSGIFTLLALCTSIWYWLRRTDATDTLHQLNHDVPTVQCTNWVWLRWVPIMIKCQWYLSWNLQSPFKASRTLCATIKSPIDVKSPNGTSLYQAKCSLRFISHTYTYIGHFVSVSMCY